MSKIVKTELITNFCKDNNISLNKFASMCNFSYASLKYILRGGERFNVVNLFKIAKVLNIKVYELVN